MSEEIDIAESQRESRLGYLQKKSKVTSLGLGIQFACGEGGARKKK